VGPLAGYFAEKSATKLRLEPVTPAIDATLRKYGVPLS
jgi:hypothetical protein